MSSLILYLKLQLWPQLLFILPLLGFFSLALSNLLYVIHLCWIILSLLPEGKVHEGRGFCLFCSLLYFQLLEQRLALSSLPGAQQIFVE